MAAVLLLPPVFRLLFLLLFPVPVERAYVRGEGATAISLNAKIMAIPFSRTDGSSLRAPLKPLKTTLALFLWMSNDRVTRVALLRSPATGTRAARTSTETGT